MLSRFPCVVCSSGRCVCLPSTPVAMRCSWVAEAGAQGLVPNPVPIEGRAHACVYVSDCGRFVAQPSQSLSQMEDAPSISFSIPRNTRALATRQGWSAFLCALRKAVEQGSQRTPYVASFAFSSRARHWSQTASSVSASI